MSLHTSHRGAPEGEPLIFLHGLGVSSWMWHDQVQALADDQLCVTVDLPGAGGSIDTPWSSLRQTADLVADVIRAEVGRPAHVVGLSLGGYVAWHMLDRHTDLVASAVLSGVTFQPLTPAWLWRALVNVGAPVLTSRAVAALSARLMGLSPDAAAAYRHDLSALAPATMRAVYDEVIDFSPVRTEADVPLLVVAGGREARAILDGLHQVHDVAPQVRTATAPGLHHTWNGEDPELFNVMLVDWITTADLTSGLDDTSTSR